MHINKLVPITAFRIRFAHQSVHREADKMMVIMVDLDNSAAASATPDHAVA